MATGNVDSGSGPREYRFRDRLISGAKLLFYGFSAAGGTLLVVDGVVKFLEYADGGVNQPVAYTMGIVGVLGLGFTLLLLAISGAVTRAMRLTNAT